MSIIQAPEMQRKQVEKPLHRANPNKLFDHIKAQYSIKADSKLADMLSLSPQVLCRMRSGDMRVNAGLILSVYDVTEMSIEDIRELL